MQSVTFPSCTYYSCLFLFFQFLFFSSEDNAEAAEVTLAEGKPTFKQPSYADQDLKTRIMREAKNTFYFMLPKIPKKTESF